MTNGFGHVGPPQNQDWRVMMSDLEQFRAETRAWLEENCPEDMRSPIAGFEDACWGGRNYVPTSEGQALWLKRMGERGWTVPTWPKAYGGGGLSKAEAKVLAQEMRRIKGPSCASKLRHLDAWPGAFEIWNRRAEERISPAYCAW